MSEEERIREIFIQIGEDLEMIGLGGRTDEGIYITRELVELAQYTMLEHLLITLLTHEEGIEAAVKEYEEALKDPEELRELVRELLFNTLLAAIGIKQAKLGLKPRLTTEYKHGLLVLVYELLEKRPDVAKKLTKDMKWLLRRIVREWKELKRERKRGR